MHTRSLCEPACTKSGAPPQSPPALSTARGKHQKPCRSEPGLCLWPTCLNMRHPDHVDKGWCRKFRNAGSYGLKSDTGVGIDSFCIRYMPLMMLRSPIWITPLPLPPTVLGIVSNDSVPSRDHASGGSSGRGLGIVFVRALASAPLAASSPMFQAAIR